MKYASSSRQGFACRVKCAGSSRHNFFAVQPLQVAPCRDFSTLPRPPLSQTLCFAENAEIAEIYVTMVIGRSAAHTPMVAGISDISAFSIKHGVSEGVGHPLPFLEHLNSIGWALFENAINLYYFDFLDF